MHTRVQMEEILTKFLSSKERQTFTRAFVKTTERAGTTAKTKNTFTDV